MGADLAPQTATPRYMNHRTWHLKKSGEVVTLTASPNSGWVVGGWSGTSNDGSTSMVNTVTMPGVNHTVTVNYSSPPIFVDGFESGSTSNWSNSVGE